MATKPSNKPAANAKDGAKAPAKASNPIQKKEGGKDSPGGSGEAKKKTAPAGAARKAEAATAAPKGKSAPQPSKKPASTAVRKNVVEAESPVPSSVKKPATPKAEKFPAPKVKADASEKKEKAPKAAKANEVVKDEKEASPAKAAKPKAVVVEAPAEAPAAKVEKTAAKPAKTAKKPVEEAPKAVAPLAKPVPPPRVKKGILDYPPDVVIKPFYNPAKMPPFIKKQQQRLIELRSALLDSMDLVAKDSLRNRPEGSEASVGGMHMADAGSDAYDRDFALSMLSKEQDALYEINEALERVTQGVYGVCELSGERINDERLEALPYTRYTREMQEVIEREQMGGRLRRAPVRSVFGLEEDGESDEDSEDEDRPANNNQNDSSLDFMKD